MCSLRAHAPVLLVSELGLLTAVPRLLLTAKPCLPLSRHPAPPCLSQTYGDGTQPDEQASPPRPLYSSITLDSECSLSSALCWARHSLPE